MFFYKLIQRFKGWRVKTAIEGYERSIFEPWVLFFLFLDWQLRQ